MEVAPGIHRVESRTGDKYLFLYIVESEAGLIVIDTGEAQHPRQAILPYLDAHDWTPADIRWILISHADADHFGGNSALRTAAPQATIACHVLDRAWVSSVEQTMATHYNRYAAEYGVAYAADVQDWLRSALGTDTPVQLGFTGGERIRLTADRDLVVLHTPGHTPGHLSFWDEATRTALVADAVLGDAVRDADGAPQSPPPYYTPQSYLSAIQTLQGLAPQCLLTCHYPQMKAEAVTDFLAQSAAWVVACDQAVRAVLRGAGEPVVLSQLIDSVDARLGPYPFKLAFKYTLAGHADQLVSAGLAARTRQAGLVAWQWTGA